MKVHIESCPFCGMSEARTDAHAREYADIEPHSIEGALSVNMDGFGWYWVMCGNCHAQGPKYHGGTNFNTGNTGPKNFRRDKDKTARAIKTAIDVWNTRTQPTLF